MGLIRDRFKITFFFGMVLPIFHSLNANAFGSAPHPTHIAPLEAMTEQYAGTAGRFIPIRAGKFIMGSPVTEEGRYANEVQREVILTEDFEMQATEVTQMQYVVVLGENPSGVFSEFFCGKGNFDYLGKFGLCPNHPVEKVSWEDAQRFIDALNSQSGQEYEYRLPTEEEWEYAARAGSDTPYFFGGSSQLALEYAWYGANSNNRSHVVASRKPNAWGFYDLQGNVSEWVQNFSEDRENAPIMRGGNWASDVKNLRSAERRYQTNTQEKSSTVGFRLVRTPR